VACSSRATSAQLVKQLSRTHTSLA
jgi:hypothetical protein